LCQLLLLRCIGGCATTSFAPPAVPIGKKLAGTETCSARDQFTDIGTLADTVAGAQRVIDLHLFVYDCAMRQTANGRQAFEIPAYLGAVGTAAAVVFGAGTDVLIAGGIKSAAMNRGKGYFDPQRKSEIYLRALNAMRCIKTESIGVPAFDPQFQTKAADMVTAKQSAITLTPAEQYYGMIEAALGAVRDIAADRLRGVGNFDPAGLQAEIIKLSADADAAKKPGTKDGAAAGDAGQAPPVGTAPAADLTSSGNTGNGQNPAPAPVPGTVQQSSEPISITPELKLAAMKPRLDLCVVRAKL
jgi:hypothetical protein